MFLKTKTYLSPVRESFSGSLISRLLAVVASKLSGSLLAARDPLLKILKPAWALHYHKDLGFIGHLKLPGSLGQAHNF